jgi:hypothetical protein
MYFNIGSDSKRTRWSVKVDAKTMAKCCDERMSYHANRMNFWSDELEKAEKMLRSDGISIKHFPVTGGQRTEAQLDPSLAKRVSECQNRMKSNQDSLNRFRAYRSLCLLAVGDL